MIDQNQDYRSALSGDDERRLASLKRSEAERPFNLQLIPLDLTTGNRGNPLRIGAPFRSIALVRGTDSTVVVNLAIHSRDESSLNNSVPLMLRDSIAFPQDIADAYLHWAAQPGKTAWLLLSLDGEFKSGTQISTVAGGVSISDGASHDCADIVLAAATATEIFAADLNRKGGTFVNEDAADLFVGQVDVANATVPGVSQKGLVVAPGEKFNYRNTAALYAYSVAGQTLTVMEES